MVSATRDDEDGDQWWRVNWDPQLREEAVGNGARRPGSEGIPAAADCVGAVGGWVMAISQECFSRVDRVLGSI